MSLAKNSENSELDKKRHSLAHLMAAAVQKMFPEAQFGIGPVIENGCYYDFILPRTLIPEDLPLLENKMREMLKQNLVYKFQEMNLEEAVSLFESKNQPLKVELLMDLKNKGTTKLDESEAEIFEGAEIHLSRNTSQTNVLTSLKAYIVEKSLPADRFNDLSYFGDVQADKEDEAWGKLIYLYYDPAKEADLVEFLKDNLLEESSDGSTSWYCEVGSKVIFSGKIFDVANDDGFMEFVEYGRSKGIPEEQLDAISARGESTFIAEAGTLQEGNKPKITVYRIVNEDTGEILFEDLCRGPHVEHVRELNGSSQSKNSPFEGWQTKSGGVDSLPNWKKRSPFPFWNLPKNNDLEGKAKELRQAGVLSETLFWQAFKNKELLGYDIDRQVIIGNYIVDFLIAELGLVVEIDGESHDFKGEQDVERERYLESLGLEIIRYKDEEIKKSMDFVSDSFQVAIKQRVAFLKESTPAVPATPQEGNNQKGNFRYSQEETHPADSRHPSQEGTLESRTNKRGISDQESASGIGFTLDKFSASYWRGDQERDIRMQRVYALVFETQVELNDFVQRREEAKRRDHRTLNTQQKWFTMSDLVGAGLALFQPKGMIIRKNIQDYLWQLHKNIGYQQVWTPHMAKEELYQTSGHAKHYLDDMFSVFGGTSKEKFYLKPMNCPHHMQLFADQQFSYKDMPVRYFEHATAYRDEKTGQLSGLTRVRNITMDDGHLFCRLDQLGLEINSIVQVIKEFMATFEMKPKWVSLSVRDSSDSWLGSTEAWKTAEDALREAAIKNEILYKIVEGEAAFYGPKLDFMFEDCLNRQQQLSTIQIDFNLPERFDLSFTNEAGEKERPVVVHRAIGGSAERFMAILIEHFGGRFPFWLAPVQVKILTVNDQVLSYVDKIKLILEDAVLMQPLKYNEIRYEIDDRSESLGKKIREAEMEKVPVILIVGPKDVEADQVSVRTQEGEQKMELNGLSDFLKKIC
jgi:threonyl-tRNA synthetase